MAEAVPTSITAASTKKRYVIILKCNPETDITEDKSRKQQFSRNLRKNAVTGAIWILDESKQKSTLNNINNNIQDAENVVILTSPIARSFFIETPRSNIREITDQEYSFLEAVMPDRRIGVLDHLQDLVKIKIYDKITVTLDNADGGVASSYDCIVHYIGPLNESKGSYFGVVFEVCYFTLLFTYCFLFWYCSFERNSRRTNSTFLGLSMCKTCRVKQLLLICRSLFIYPMLIKSFKR